MVGEHEGASHEGHRERRDGRPSPVGVHHNLRVPLTNLLGRGRDLAGIVDTFSGGRLLTLIGPGGVGKTRLALSAAWKLVRRYQDGTWHIDLDDAGEFAEPWVTVATALGMERYGGASLPERIVAHLRPRQALLIMDNCDPLAAECAHLATSLAAACPDVSLLCTSRQPLGIAGERLWPLGGLSVDAPPGTGSNGAARAPAVRLFVERAVAQQPDFALGARQRGTVAELCRRLEGLPLAIELAAALVGTLSPEEILAHLDDRLALLVRPGPPMTTRHRSLAASVAWSHDRLRSDEAVLFRRLAVFEGGFTLAAAQDVCGAPPIADRTVLALLTSLVAKSFVRADPADAGSRYRLFENTRAYAADRLAAAGEATDISERHARWALRMAKEAHASLRNPAAGQWLARLAADHDNMQAALAWAVAHERSDLALAIAAAMATFWGRKRLFSTGREWLVKTLALPEQPAPLRVEALLALGYLIGESGDRSAATRVLDEACQLAEHSGDARGEARALKQLGYFQLFLDSPTAALPPLQRSTEKARVSGDQLTMLEALSHSGWVAMFGGDAREAEVRFRECLATADGEQSRPKTWGAVVGMAWVALSQGRLDDADDWIIEALEGADRILSKDASAVVGCFRGQIARARGDYRRARAFLGEALAMARMTTNPFPIAMRLTLLGGVARDEGDLDGAESALVEALAVPGAAVLPLPRAQSLVALASVRLIQHRPEESGALLDEASTVARAYGLRGVMASALLERARLRRLDDDLQEAARTVIQAIALGDRLGDTWGLVDAVETLAGVRANQGRCRIACRLLAAASSTRRNTGLVRAPVRGPDYEADVALVTSELSAEDWESLSAAGAELSMPRAAALAVKYEGRRDSARTGWDAITPTERQVVALVAQGLTNREAAARLVVSSRTVETHVAHVLAKVGISSRRELARIASAKGFG